jgi:hypothetical protein
MFGSFETDFCDKSIEIKNLWGTLYTKFQDIFDGHQLINPTNTPHYLHAKDKLLHTNIYVIQISCGKTCPF